MVSELVWSSVIIIIDCPSTHECGGVVVALWW